MIFAHFSDCHLGYRQYNVDERENDFYEAFNEVVERILEEHVDFVIHSGDMFEYSRPPTKALLVVKEAMRKFQERGIPVYAVPGNHDISMRRGAMPPHVLFKDYGMHVISLKNCYYEHDDDVLIAGCPYIPRFYSRTLAEHLQILARIAEKYKKRILILHQAIDRYLPFDYQIKVSDLPKNFDYYALGHVHLRITDRFGRGTLGYAGSIEVWRVDEWYDFRRRGKGFYIVDISGDEVEVHRINIESVRPHLIEEVNVENMDGQLEALLRKLRSFEGKKPVLHLLVKGKHYNISLIHNKILRKLSNHALTVRINYSIEEERTSEVLRSDNINVRDLLEKAIKSKELAELAYELFCLLSRDEIEGARKVIDDFYRRASL
ncbi:MAG: metallophosphoesterase family protein [Candidatus Baldrarchaeia archaeon]